jgi:hypothetical protein
VWCPESRAGDRSLPQKKIGASSVAKGKLDRTAALATFVPATDSVSDAVESLWRLAPELQSAVVEAAVTLAKVRALATASAAASLPSALQSPMEAERVSASLRSASSVDSAFADALTATMGALHLVRAAVKAYVPAAKVAVDSMSCGFPDPFCAALQEVLKREYAVLSSVATVGPHLPSMKRFRWRLDVQIATSSSSRVLRPTVLVELSLSDGSVHTISASIEQFHALRYGVGKVLRQMVEDESHFVLRLAADMERASLRKRDK